MKVITVHKFECDICGAVYDQARDALTCEDRPVSQDKGVKLGDKVRIIQGDGIGVATVTERFVISMTWSPDARRRYWHTIGLVAKCDVSYGSRLLTFDDYETL